MRTALTFRKSTIALAMAVAGLMPLVVSAGSDTDKAMNQTPQSSATEEVKQSFSNGWREGKIETALLFNTHLNNFKIDSEVRGDNAILTGQVSSDIERDLAEEIALSVEGVNSVDNKLVIIDSAERKTSADAGDKFLSAVSDATISAKVKMKFLANDNLSGFKIDVDTKDHVVTLKGKVGSSTERELAEKVAANTDNVKRVNNRLQVEKSS